jgi:hypothetical protein
VVLDERQPVPPPALDGLPFRPAEFDGLTVTPYVAEGAGRPRVAYSIRARAMRAPSTGRPPHEEAAGAVLEPAPGRSRLDSCRPGVSTVPQHAAEEGPVTVQRARDRVRKPAGRRCRLGDESSWATRCRHDAVVAVQDRTGAHEWVCERHAALALDLIVGSRISAVVDWPACGRLLALPWNRPGRSR